MVAVQEKIAAEVIEIYPKLKKKNSEKFHDQGTCHVHLQLGDFAMEIKNVMYKVSRSGKCWIGMPGKRHADLSKGEGGYIFVPSISFADAEIVSKIKEAIKEDLEKDFKAPLVEDENL